MVWPPHLYTRPAQSSLRQENVTVFGCLTHEVPLSLGDAAMTCSKGGVRNRARSGGWKSGVRGWVWRKDGLGRLGTGGRRVRVL